MTYVDILAPRALRTADGIEIRLRSPLSRSVPLSTVSLRVSVDGVELDPGRLTLCVNDCDHGLDDLPALFDVEWYTLDAARVRITLADPRPTHEVEVALGIRLPFARPADGIVVSSVERRDVQVVGEAESR